MKKKVILSIVALVAVMMLLPQSVKNPVEGAGSNSYNHQTFWHPWGDHHHHGIDIFARCGTPVRSACYGIVLRTRINNGRGGNTVLVLGTRGRMYYYAHLDEVKTHPGAFVTQNTVIGTVGNTGNAKNTPAHLHFSISTPIPRLDHIVPLSEQTKWDDKIKPFFINPVKELGK
jgi:murein DD-endopeptidase MepM/ murein hydrolase activator NlpD